LPKYATVNPQTDWTHLDADAVKQDFPMWGFATHQRHAVECAHALADVLEAVRAKTAARPDFVQAAAARVLALSGQRERRVAAAAQAAAEPGTTDALSPAYVCAAIARALGPEDVIINEAIRNSPAVLNQIPRDQPLTLLASAGGGLGHSGGAALGAKLARPQTRVVQIVGDGGFHFSTPTSVYAVAQQYQLPILTVVLDNGGWQAVKEATLRMYPDGAAAQGQAFQSRLQGATRDFAKVGEAFGAHGETVREPADLDGAIARCIAAVDGGQAAVLVVRIKPI
jgi:acetolactate synthase-1/2/3 large subunit